jgi:hypothetical protein
MTRTAVVRAIRWSLAVTVPCGCIPAVLSDEDAIVETDFPHSVARAYCQSGAACCSKWYGSFDASACESVVAKTEASKLDSARELGGSYVPSEAPRFLALVREAAAACEPSDELRKALRVAEERLVTGERAPGDACEAATQCADPPDGWGACGWHGVGYSCLGARQCAAVRSGGNANAPCHPGVEPPADVPFPCSFSVPPDEVWTCDGSQDLYCRSETNVCARRLELGAFCEPSRDLCRVGLDCIFSQCVAEDPLGGECATHEGCGSGAACVEGLCVVAVPAGGACSISEDCEVGATCPRGRCIPPSVIMSADFCGQ